MTILTAHWDLEGDSVDHVGGFNGTDTSITYGNDYGVFGQGALLNGTTSKIVITDHANLKPTGAFTVGAWFKTSYSAGDNTIFHSCSQNPAIAGIKLIAVGSVDDTLYLYSGKNTGTGAGTDYQKVNSITAVCDGVWHLGIGTWDGSYLNIFIDGKHEGKIAWANAPVYASTNYVIIGSANLAGSDSSLFNGSLDEVFLINGTALSAQEIWELYNGSYLGMVRS